MRRPAAQWSWLARSQFCDRCQNRAVSARASRGSPIGAPARSSNSTAPVCELTRTRDPARSPALDHLGRGKTPPIAVPGRRSGPSAAAWRRRAPDSTTSDCHDAARRAGRPRPAMTRAAVRVRRRARCRRSAAPCARPRAMRSTQERSLSRQRGCGSGMQPFEVDAVPGPACAARAADDAGGAERPAAGRARLYAGSSR